MITYKRRQFLAFFWSPSDSDVGGAPVLHALTRRQRRFPGALPADPPMRQWVVPTPL